MMRIPVMIGAFLSPLLFPFPLTVLLALVASLFFPPAGLLIGALVDALYYVPGSLPLGLIWGAVLTFVAFFVRRFMKARIIGG